MVPTYPKRVTYLPWMVRNSFRMVRNIQKRSRPISQGLDTFPRVLRNVLTVQFTYTNRLATIRNRLESSFSTFGSLPERLSTIQKEVANIRERFRTLQKELRTIRGMVANIRESYVPSGRGTYLSKEFATIKKEVNQGLCRHRSVGHRRHSGSQANHPRASRTHPQNV